MLFHAISFLLVNPLHTGLKDLNYRYSQGLRHLLSSSQKCRNTAGTPCQVRTSIVVLLESNVNIVDYPSEHRQCPQAEQSLKGSPLICACEHTCKQCTMSAIFHPVLFQAKAWMVLSPGMPWWDSVQNRTRSLLHPIEIVELVWAAFVDYPN